MAQEEEFTINTGIVGQQEVNYWSTQIAAALKREEKFRKRARRALEIYQLDRETTDAYESEVPFNILYSNTETMLPALYNEVPRPIVSRRYKDDNALAKAGAEALQRGLSYSIDNPTAGYESLHPMLENAVLSALVPGRGITRFRYDADIKEYNTKKDTGDDDALRDGDIDGEEPAAGGRQQTQTAIQQTDSQQAQDYAQPPEVHNEAVCASVVQWDRIVYGYAKRWDRVPFVAFEFNMTKKDVEKAFGKSWTTKLTFSNKDEKDSEAGDDQKRAEATCRVWEIWHKTNREVCFYAEGYQDSLVRTVPDPLGLSGFFPIPEPLTMFIRVEGLVPVPLYGFYQKQAQELNRLTVRIEKVVGALKVRGFYDKGLGEIANLLVEDDNTLLPAVGVGRMQGEGQSLDKSIWLMPLEKLAAVLQQLQQQREAVKAVIYEITGISDILRGASQASETATAQNIKNQWGTLRLKKAQKRVQRYVRDCFRIMAEIMAEKFGEDTFAKMTGLPYLPTAQKEQLKQQVAALQMQVQQQQLSAGGPPAPGGPPSPPAQAPGTTTQEPPAPDPMQLQLQQLQAQLAVPSWGEVLGLLKDELLRGFSIDVETNSTIDPEAAEDRQALGEMMQAFSGTLQQYVPAVQQGIIPMPVFKAMMKNISKRFQFGNEMEDAVNQMPDQLPPQGPDPKQVEQQAKQAQQAMDAAQKKELQVQQREQELQLEERQIESSKQMALKEIDMREKEALMRIKMAEQAADLDRQQKDAKSQMALERDFHGREMSLAQTTQQNTLAHQKAVSDGENRLRMKESQMRSGLQAERMKMAGEGPVGPGPAMPAPPKSRRLRVTRKGGALVSEELQ